MWDVVILPRPLVRIPKSIKSHGNTGGSNGRGCGVGSGAVAGNGRGVGAGTDPLVGGDVGEVVMETGGLTKLALHSRVGRASDIKTSG